MRNFKLLSLISLGVLCSIGAFAQTKPQPAIVKCATDAAIEEQFRNNPALKAEYDRKSAEVLNGTSSNSTARLTTLTAPVVIPVVVHVVLPNPNQITEAQIDYLLNRLNLDFSGFNADSTNAALFYPVRGHSLLRFTRARRTPTGTITNGVERRIGSIAIPGTTYQAIKHTSDGGLDPWDVTQYYNIWIGGAGALSILGIAPGIGVGGQTETNASATGIDGVVFDYRAASNGCFSDPLYRLGRTAVHEIGHNFGLYHPFPGCTLGADFGQPTPAGQTLPATLVGAAPDDTPPTSAPTYGCVNGVLPSACPPAVAPNPPGKMYQNIMDYGDDPCLTLFTKNQVERMHYMLETYRPGYLTTQGANPPAGFPTVDAGINAILSPGGSAFNDATCVFDTYPTPTCPGTFIPRISITNFGNTTITSVIISITVGATTTPVPFTVNLATNATTTLAFPAQTLVTGANAISFAITSVNGSTTLDTYTPNNTATTTANVATATALPFTQNFTTTTFPPANMTVFNPNNNNTWVYNAAGNVTPGSAFINNYTNDFTGQFDDLRTIPLTPPANVTTQDSVIISFDLAHRPFSLTNPTYFDTLKVLVSTDCGVTFNTVYSRWPTSVPSLATGPISGGSFITPVASDWRRERISIGRNLLISGPIIVAFRNITKFGNNTFIDNINISRNVERDLTVSAIVSPASTICANNVTPQITVANGGIAPITSFRVGYRISGGPVTSQIFTQTIAPGASATLTLAPATAIPTGVNTFTVFTADPTSASGIGDQNMLNDTLSKSFITNIDLPLFEGFESTTFPPANWTIFNPGTDVTWIRAPRGNNSIASAFINNYDNDLVGAIDALQSFPLRTAGTDSIIVEFDVAHKNYPGFADSLLVLASTNCGTSFTRYFGKGGATLATAGSSTASYLNPAESDWRRERVSIPSAAFASGNTIIRIQNVNDYGNNIFVDNINISSIFRRDVQLLSINQPANVVCPGSVPSVTVKNVGVDTIRGFKVAYTVDNGAAVSSTFNNVTLPNGATQTVSLAALNIPAGTHTLKFYTFDPVTATGTGDLNVRNDTLVKIVAAVGPASAAPLVEGFETPTFPPANWALFNADGATTWQRTTNAARLGNASAFVSNFNYNNNNGSVDELYTPQVTYTGVDSISLSFDVAALTNNYPGSTVTPLDTLEVFATADCGATLTSIYKKWGNDLQTINDPNFPQNIDFVPINRNQWRRETIDLTGFANRTSLQIMFRNTTNSENNIYLDNIGLATKTLPAKLKEQGYLIYPSPFTTNFTIQHYLSPTELRGIAVYNSVGQRVYAQSYGAGGASSFMQVNMSHLASGLYTVVLRYTNRTISQKIIKAQ